MVKKVKKEDKKEKHAKCMTVFFLLLVIGFSAWNFVEHKEGHFTLDGIPFFYAWFGFLSALVLVAIAKTIGFFCARPLDYYEE